MGQPQHKYTCQAALLLDASAGIRGEHPANALPRRSLAAAVAAAEASSDAEAQAADLQIPLRSRCGAPSLVAGLPSLTDVAAKQFSEPAQIISI